MSKTLSKAEWVAKARKIHGKKYNYDLVIYTGWRNKVTITCPVHGNFDQAACAHLSGQDCKQCVIPRADTRKDFIAKAKKTHGRRYDYSNAVYTNAHNTVIITCRIHGDFEQVASAHTYGQGCRRCSHIKNPKLLDAVKTGNAALFNRVVYEEGLEPVVKNGEISAPRPFKVKRRRPTKAEVKAQALLKAQQAATTNGETIRSLVPIPDSKLAILTDIKALGAYSRRGHSEFIKMYSGLNRNDGLQYFYISDDERIAITAAELNRFWFKCY